MTPGKPTCILLVGFFVDSAWEMKFFFIFRVELFFIAIFALRSHRKRISMTYMDIIHHGMPPSDTTTTNLPEHFRGDPKMCFIIIKYPNVYIN